MENKLNIPLSVPFINGNEWKYVKECFDTNWVSSAGKYVNKFEELICKKFNVKNAVAVINGTSALHLALLSLGIGKSDEVIVPTVTFVAPINTVKYTGAEPVFIDCEERFFNIDVKKVEEFLENECSFDGEKVVNKKTGKLVKAIMPVHIFGALCDLILLKTIADKYKLKIIEDATEAIGSKIVNSFAGTIGDIGCYSFNGNKLITTGGGGVVVSNSDELANKIRHLSTQAKSDVLFYDHDEIGFNYRMTNITAAFGVAQLEQLDSFIEIKRKNAELYKDKLSGIKGIEFRANDPVNSFSNKWFYSLIVDKSQTGISRDELMYKLIEEGVECRPIWKLNHSLKPFINCESYKIEIATSIYDQVLNIPCSVSLTQDEINYVVEKIKKYI